MRTMLTAAAGALALLGGGLAAGTALAQAAEAAAPSAEAAELARVIADYEAFDRARDPFTAGFEGDREALSRLPDVSRAAELAQIPALQAFAARLGAIDPARLGDEDRLNHAFLSRVVTRELRAIELDGGRLAFDSEGGPGAFAGYLASSTRIAGRADAEAYLSRLAQLGGLYAAMLDNARRGLETGFVQPRPVVESALALMRAEAALAEADDPLLRPLASLPASIPAEAQAELRARAAALVAEHVAPQRQAWVRFIEADYLPAAPEGLGVGQRPGGREFYAFQAQGYTTTDMTPDEIHQLGLEEVARIRAEMDVEMRASGWSGDFAGFLNFLRTDPQFYAQSREALLRHASEMAKRADDGLPALFWTLPRLPYGVRRVPREIEANYTTGRYNPGSQQNGVAGGYMVNTGRLDQRPLYELPALTLHEAVPGHHLQIALQQELGDQPWFRRNADVTAFVEGWGLYAEFLGVEMGFYRDPYERFGRLSYEMWRACRLVADTGIHWLGWDLEQARACFRDNSALAPHNIETELERYVSWPGQALGYKIGELRLKALRQRAEAALGEAFDVRRFHDAVLLGGPLPMDLLEARIEAWIAAQAPRPAG